MIARTLPAGRPRGGGCGDGGGAAMVSLGRRGWAGRVKSLAGDPHGPPWAPAPEAPPDVQHPRGRFEDERPPRRGRVPNSPGPERGAGRAGEGPRVRVDEGRPPREAPRGPRRGAEGGRGPPRAAVRGPPRRAGEGRLWRVQRPVDRPPRGRPPEADRGARPNLQHLRRHVAHRGGPEERRPDYTRNGEIRAAAPRARRALPRGDPRTVGPEDTGGVRGM